MSLGAISAQAGVLMYSFETGDSPNGKDGFVNNGTTSVTQTTTGATVGSDALQIVTPGGYVGTYTQGDLPAPLANPNLSAVTLDLTVSPNDPAFTGTYSDMGISLFVSNPGEGEYGDQYAVPNTDWVNIDLAPGTYNLSIPITGNDPDSGNPITFGNLLGEGWYVSGFQLILDGNGAQTVYVDNVQAVVPEPASLSLIGLTGSLLLSRRRRKN
jgi:hypothetical protein